MKKLNEKIWHAIFSWDAYNAVAQELQNIESQKRVWVGLHILKHYESKLEIHRYKLLKNCLPNKFTLIIFEMDKSRLEELKKYDDEIDSENDINLLEKFCFNSEEELYEICYKNNINPEKFNQVWKCEYPLD